VGILLLPRLAPANREEAEARPVGWSLATPLMGLLSMATALVSHPEAAGEKALAFPPVVAMVSRQKPALSLASPLANLPMVLVFLHQPVMPPATLRLARVTPRLQMPQEKHQQLAQQAAMPENFGQRKHRLLLGDGAHRPQSPWQRAQRAGRTCHW